MSVAPKWGFLKLPRELRDIIYTHYARVDGGYTYNLVTNQLVRADGGCIEHALTLTCRQVAAEMRGLALTMNKITFRTYHSEETNDSAAHFHNSISTAQGAKARLLDDMAPRYLTSDMSKAAAAKFPCLEWILHDWRHEDYPQYLFDGRYPNLFPQDSWGQSYLVWTEFVDFTLKLISEHPDFPSEPQSIKWGVWNQYDAARLIHMHLPPPWAVLGSDEAHKLQADVASATGIHGYRHPFSEHMDPFPSKPYKYTYSAASLAIRFLDSIPNSTRQYIRNVLLDEDQESIANASCHALGLALFCHENRQMIIKRNVNLWTACLLVQGKGERLYYHSYMVTCAIGSWMIEAAMLPKLGMPSDSFQLILDGEPLPELAQSVFDVVTKDATVQIAMNIWFDKSQYPRVWRDFSEGSTWIWNDFPEVYQDFMAGKLSNLIQCNFDINVGPDPEEMVERFTGSTSLDWYEYMYGYNPRYFTTEAPLPPLHLLRPASLLSQEMKGPIGGGRLDNLM
ncbi:hypothetical protein DM02DRAFT_613978 [Periconia macrospinosa]|uniref:Uncharacterized protein n=1 Tax=Periconia macrospinosa TaxID=97972 RepID=A0A2V1DT25_9PLEO|nr:hypothetical protein DM02DRAFT_613978 [Periconia macrospinosa]